MSCVTVVLFATVQPSNNACLILDIVMMYQEFILYKNFLS